MWEGSQHPGTDDRSDTTQGRKTKNPTRLGPGLKLKGEISGSEDLYIDGEVEGKIELAGNTLTIGPSGNVHAAVAAESITVQGYLRGKVEASERTMVRSTGTVEGELTTTRLVVDDGAVLKGRIATDQPTQAQADARRSKKPVASAPAGAKSAQRKSAGRS